LKEKGYEIEEINGDQFIEKVFQDIGNFWISAGGDLFIKGNDAAKTGWEIGIQDPLDL